MNCKTPVCNIFREVFARPQMIGTSELELLKDSKESFFPGILELCAFEVITDNEKSQIRPLIEFCLPQYTNEEHRAAFAFVRNSNTTFSIDSHGVQFRGSALTQQI